MTRARKTLVSVEATPYYHVMARCVRRAFLCGVDTFSGKSFEHRKGWVVARLKELSEVFAIDLCAYAIMANHYHLVVRIDEKKAQALTDEEVISRWQRLFTVPMLVARFQAKAEMSEAERRVAQATLDDWRARLMDLSWFMRCLNEHLARLANEEDGCKGRFWEGRFKSQALLDEQALLSCMSYVDLNPIRAGIAETPENSDFTSIQARIEDWATAQSALPQDTLAQDAPHASPTRPSLLAFAGPLRQDSPDGLPFALRDYFELVDWAGRAVREDKRGAISDKLPPILTRLGIDGEQYLNRLKRNRGFTGNVLGRVQAIKEAASALGRKFLKGQREAQQLFPVASR